MGMRPEGGKERIEEVDGDYALIKGGNGGSYIRLDLACGRNKRPGFIGVDISQESDADLFHDLEGSDWITKDEDYKWGYKFWWEESSINEINCEHFVEHVRNLKRFMENVWKILVPGGTMKIVAPYWSHIGADQDFTHVRRINEMTFKYFNKPTLNAMNIGHYSVECDFDIVLTRFIFEPEWTDRSEEAREWARIHYLNVVREIEVYLKAVKPMRK